MNWDDLRYILAVADYGTTVAAASHLEVNATTIQRRITRFEQNNGIHLFERRPSGLTPTPECVELLSEARQIENSVLSIRRDILGRDLRPEGRLTVTTTDTFMRPSMAADLAKFKTMHPAIQLDVTLTNTRLDLSRSDADIAIRPSNNPPEMLVGQRVSGLAFAIHAPRNWKGRAQKAANAGRLGTLPWVGIGNSLSLSTAGSWMVEHVDPDCVAITIDTFLGMRTAISAGHGLGLLPCVLAYDDPDIVRIGEPLAALETSLWILTHPEIRRAAKVRAFMDFMAKAIRDDAPFLEGRK